MNTGANPGARNIESLDFKPPCTLCDKTAVYWIDAHGCMEFLLCVDCLTERSSMVMQTPKFFCSSCMCGFTNIDDFWPVRIRL